MEVSLLGLYKSLVDVETALLSIEKSVVNAVNPLLGLDKPLMGIEADINHLSQLAIAPLQIVDTVFQLPLSSSKSQNHSPVISWVVEESGRVLVSGTHPIGGCHVASCGCAGHGLVQRWSRSRVELSVLVVWRRNGFLTDACIWRCLWWTWYWFLSAALARAAQGSGRCVRRHRRVRSRFLVLGFAILIRTAWCRRWRSCNIRGSWCSRTGHRGNQLGMDCLEVDAKCSS